MDIYMIYYIKLNYDSFQRRKDMIFIDEDTYW